MMGIVKILDFCFNTQPPEGGWHRAGLMIGAGSSFNTQPPEGGWRAGIVFAGG